MERSSKYPDGVILIDPTPQQVSDALSKGINPDAGRALLDIARRGKLSRYGEQAEAQDLVDLAWEQLGEEVGGTILNCEVGSSMQAQMVIPAHAGGGSERINFDPSRLPSEQGHN